MHYVVTAPGKMIVLGEYAVLDGADCLVWGVNRRVEVRLTRHQRSELVVHAKEIGVPTAVADLHADATLSWREDDRGGPRGRLAMVHAAVTTALSRVDCDWSGGLEITVDTSGLYAQELGIKLGLGSSAAVVVAVTGAVLGATGLSIESESGRRVVFECALAAHSRAQGHVGSGADVAASTYGGCLRYRRGSTPRATPTPESLTLADGLIWHAVFTGHSASTPSMVAHVRRWARGHPREYDAHMRQLARLAVRGSDALAAAQWDLFSEAVGAGFEALGVLGAACGVDIVSRDHQRIADLVRAEGGVYKPSGAGGGDLGIACCSNQTMHRAVGAALEHAGYVVVPLGIDIYGLRKTP